MLPFHQSESNSNHLAGLPAEAFLETAEAQAADIQGRFVIHDDFRYQPACDGHHTDAVTAEASGQHHAPALPRQSARAPAPLGPRRPSPAEMANGRQLDTPHMQAGLAQ